MKILVVIPYFYPVVDYGGPVTMSFELSRWLMQKGHKLKILTTDAGSKEGRLNTDRAEYLRENPKTYRLKNLSNFLAYNYRLFFPIEGLSTIGKLVKNSDVIHFHDLFTPLHIIAGYYAKKLNKPYIITPHGVLDPVRLRSRYIAKKLFWTLGIKNFLMTAAIIHTLTSTETEEVKNALHNDNVSTVEIPNGLDIINKNQQAGEKYRNKYSIPPDSFVAAFLGRLDRLKGLDVLIESCSSMIESNNFYLMLGGPDFGYKTILQKLAKKLKISESIIFTGTVLPEEKAAFYSAADIFIYSSLSEGFSLAILEALSAGLPVVISRGCKFPAVQQKKAGFVFETSTVLQDSILQLLSDRPLYTKMRKNATNLAEKYSWRNIGPRFEKMYQIAVEQDTLTHL